MNIPPELQMFAFIKFLSQFHYQDSKSDYFPIMDQIKNKFKVHTNLDIEYKLEDFRFEASIVNVYIQMEGLYINEDQFTKLLIVSSSGKTFNEAIEKILIKINELDIDKIKNNLRKYTKTYITDKGYRTKYLI